MSHGAPHRARATATLLALLARVGRQPPRLRTSTGRSTRPGPRSWTRGGRSSPSRCSRRSSGRSPTDLKALAPISNDANSGGSSYGSGWYSYVDEAVRAALGSSRSAAHGAHLRRRHGGVVRRRCSGSRSTRPATSSPPRRAPIRPRWRADATAERIHFAGFLADTMRWTNRPTFQQVIVLPLASLMVGAAAGCVRGWLRPSRVDGPVDGHAGLHVSEVWPGRTCAAHGPPARRAPSWYPII